MALPQDEWLPQAKRLAIGMKDRVRHLRENRPNLVISNQRDRWTAYCQKCKEGGVVMKDHVLLTGPTVVTAADLVLPRDIKPVIGSEFAETVGRFLASKGMMFPYLPKLYYSETARRMLLQDDAGKWHGRDLTGKSDRKWLNYAHAQFVGTPTVRTAVTEDLFSMYKMRFALRDTDWSICCALGASCGPASALALKNVRQLVWAFDGDHAGDEGFKQGQKRMRVFVPKQYRFRPPEGMDPKDMNSDAIRALLEESLCK